MAALADWVAARRPAQTHSNDIDKFYKENPAMGRKPKGLAWLSAELLVSQGLRRRPATGGFLIEADAELAADDDTTCSVCMDRVPDHRVDCPAGHQFCLSCIQQWFNRSQSSCPSCKQLVSEAVLVGARVAVATPPRAVATPRQQPVVSPGPMWGDTPPPPPPPPPSHDGEMTALLRSLNLEEQYARLFTENEIDIQAIPCLQREDWRDLGVPIGHKSRIVSKIRELHPEVW